MSGAPAPKEATVEAQTADDETVLVPARQAAALSKSPAESQLSMPPTTRREREHAAVAARRRARYDRVVARAGDG